MGEKNTDITIPYGRQSITEDDINAVVKVLRGPFLTQGMFVPKFEESVAKRVGAKYGVAANSATSALHIACLALELGPGDRLWTSPISFVASANCGKYCGAVVDFVDIEPRTGLMSVEALAVKLERAKRLGTLPKVVVPVHLTGSSCDMKAIGSLARLYNFKVLEDASHAIGSEYQGEAVGGCRYSSITVFSFHPVKIITTGEGGLATTNDPELASRMSELRSHGIVRDVERFEQPSSGPWMYEQQRLGFNYRMTDIQAALGLSQLERLDDIINERNRLLAFYKEVLVDMPVRLLDIPKDVRSSVHLAVIQLQGFDAGQHRRIFEGLRANGIGVQLHYSPIHLQPYYRHLGLKEGDFPNAEAYSHKSFSIPLFPSLTHAMQKRVVSEIEAQLQLECKKDK